MQEKVYGLEADLTTGTFKRLGCAAGKKPGVDFDDIKMFGGRKRCNLNNEGIVLAYYGDAAYSENGRLTADVIKGGKLYPAGTFVQTMVEQPKFYYKVEPIVLEDIESGIGQHLKHGKWYVAEEPIDGFKLHPNFIRNGRKVDYTYSAAFEGSLYNAVAGEYCLEDEQIFGEKNTAADMLCSIAGAKPASGTRQRLTRANSRILAGNRGSGWQVIDFLALTATEILMFIEYASFNAQKMLGRGVVSKEPGESNSSEKTGRTSYLGNTSGSAAGEVGFSPVSYRGEENLYGNIWGIVDGLNFECKGVNAVWYADHGFIDDCKDAPYRNTGFTLCKENGYVSAFGYSKDCDFMFLPSEVKGTEDGPVGDFFMQKHEFDGWQISLFGGRWSQGPKPGLFFWYADCAAGNASKNINARIMYVP